MVTPHKILIIRSETSELKKLRSFLSEVFEENKLPDKCFNKVLLCVSEAVVNSIQHGNRYNKEKQVCIKVEINKSTLHVTIIDEGQGFDSDKISDPTLPENITKESGRGIHIIKSCCDQVEFDKNKSLIRFKLD